MFRLIKLAFYAVIGFAFYEFMRGLLEEPAAQHRGRRDLTRALKEDSGRMGTLTGAGEGRTESTDEASGTSVPHRVGRGVTTS